MRHFCIRTGDRKACQARSGDSLWRCADTAKWLNQYLDVSAPRQCMHVSADGVWADDSHRVTPFVHADAGRVCACYCYELRARRIAAIGG